MFYNTEHSSLPSIGTSHTAAAAVEPDVIWCSSSDEESPPETKPGLGSRNPRWHAPMNTAAALNSPEESLRFSIPSAVQDEPDVTATQQSQVQNVDVTCR